MDLFLRGSLRGPNASCRQYRFMEDRGATSACPELVRRLGRLEAGSCSCCRSVGHRRETPQAVHETMLGVYASTLGPERQSLVGAAQHKSPAINGPDHCL